MENKFLKDILKKILSIALALGIALGMAPLLTSADILGENSSSDSSVEDIFNPDEEISGENLEENNPDIPPQNNDPDITFEDEDDSSQNNEPPKTDDDLPDPDQGNPIDAKKSEEPSGDKPAEPIDPEQLLGEPVPETEEPLVATQSPATTLFASPFSLAGFNFVMKESDNSFIPGSDPRITPINSNSFQVDKISKLLLSHDLLEDTGTISFAIHHYDGTNSNGVGTSLPAPSSGVGKPTEYTGFYFSFDFSNLPAGKYTVRFTASQASPSLSNETYVVFDLTDDTPPTTNRSPDPQIQILPATSDPVTIRLTSKYQHNPGTDSTVEWSIFGPSPTNPLITSGNFAPNSSLQDFAVSTLGALAPGTYTVKLTEAVDGNSQDRTLAFYITDTPPPIRTPKPVIIIEPQRVNPNSITLRSEYINNMTTASTVVYTITAPNGNPVPVVAFPQNLREHTLYLNSLGALSPGIYTVSLTEAIDGTPVTETSTFEITAAPGRVPAPSIDIRPSSIDPQYITLNSKYNKNPTTDSAVNYTITAPNGSVVPTPIFPLGAKELTVYLDSLGSLAPGTYSIVLNETVDQNHDSITSTFVISAPTARIPDPKISILPSSVDPVEIEFESKYEHNPAVDSQVEYGIFYENGTPVMLNNSPLTGILFPSSTKRFTFNFSQAGLELAGGKYIVKLAETVDGETRTAEKFFTISSNRMPNPKVAFLPAGANRNVDPESIRLRSEYPHNPTVDSDVQWIIKTAAGVSIVNGSFIANQTEHTLNVLDYNLGQGVYYITLTEIVDGNAKTTEKVFSIDTLGIRLPNPEIQPVDYSDEKNILITLSSNYQHNPSADAMVNWVIKNKNTGIEVKSGLFLINEKTRTLNVSQLGLEAGEYVIELTETIDNYSLTDSQSFKISRNPDPKILVLDNVNNTAYENPARILLKSKYAPIDGSVINWTISDITNGTSVPILSGEFKGDNNDFSDQTEFTTQMPKNIGKYVVTMTEKIDGTPKTDSSEFVITKIEPAPTASVNKNPNPTQITLTSKHLHDPNIESTVSWTIVNNNDKGKPISSGTFKIGERVHYPPLPYAVGSYTVTVIETIGGLSATASATFEITDISPDANIWSDKTTNPTSIILYSKYPHNPKLGSSNVTWQLLDKYNRVIKSGNFVEVASSHNLIIPTAAGSYRVVVRERINNQEDVSYFDFTITRSSTDNHSYDYYSPAKNNRIDSNSSLKVRNYGNTGSSPSKPMFGGSDTKPSSTYSNTSPTNINHNPSTGS